jgi:hypothetical protein
LGGDLLRGLIERVHPEAGISHTQGQEENAKRMWPWILALVDFRHFYKQPFLYEGDALLPSLCAQFVGNPDVKIAFVGMPDADVETKFRHIRDYPSDGEWTEGKSDDELREMINDFIGRGERLRNKCKELRIPFFDTSRDFERSTREVVNYFINK